MPPLAFAVQLGMRGTAQPILIPYTISAGGNTVTLNCSLAQETKERANRDGVSTVEALAACLRGRSTTLGIVHAYSTHNLLLRYWLATAGIEAGRDVKLAVIPPAQAVETLTSGQIAGFCAGAPWGEVARRAGVGATIAVSRDIWQNAPEKALAVRARWAEERPEALAGAIRALLRAAKFCDSPENAAYTAALLSRHKYLDVDSTLSSPAFPAGRRPIGAASSFGVRRPTPGDPTDCGSSVRCDAGDWSMRVLTCAAWPSASIALTSIEPPSRIWANRRPSRTGNSKAAMMRAARPSGAGAHCHARRPLLRRDHIRFKRCSATGGGHQKCTAQSLGQVCATFEHN